MKISTNTEHYQLHNLSKEISIAIGKSHHNELTLGHGELHTISFLSHQCPSTTRELNTEIIFTPAKETYKLMTLGPHKLTQIFLLPKFVNFRCVNNFDQDIRDVCVTSLRKPIGHLQFEENLEGLINECAKTNPNLPSIEQAVDPLIKNLIVDNQAVARPAMIKYSGGLSPKARRMVIGRINDGPGQKILLRDLANIANLSPFHFSKMFKQTTGLSPISYVRNARISLAKSLLVTETPLSQIAKDAGFCSQSHFTHQFSQSLGITPLKYKYQGGSKSETISS